MVRIKNKFIKIILMLILIATMLATITIAQSEDAQMAGYHSILYTDTITDYNGSEPIVILNGLISQGVSANQFCLGTNCINTWANVTSGIGESKWEESGANIYRSSGNVGIGTTNPVTKIHTKGTTQTDNGITIESYGTSANDYYHRWKLELLGNSGANRRFSITELHPTGAERLSIIPGGNVGIGTNNPSARLDVAGNITSSGVVSASTQVNAPEYCDANGANCFTSSAVGGGGSLWTESGSNIYRFSGDVGIGTNNPSAKLDVVGSTELNGNLAVTGDLVVDGSTLRVDDVNDRVGVGTSNPSARLDVVGNTELNGNLVVTGSAEFSKEIRVGNSGSRITGCGATTVGSIQYVEYRDSSTNLNVAAFQVCMQFGDYFYEWTNVNERSWTITGGGGCFLPGTKVIMADGSLKNIEDIIQGEYVLSYDELAKKYVSSKVNELLVHTPQNTMEWYAGYYEFVTDRGILVRVTENHPVYASRSKDEGWDYFRVDELREGDFVVIATNTDAIVDVIADLHFVKEDLSVVYNLELSEPHNYFADGLLVHNDKVEPV